MASIEYDDEAFVAEAALKGENLAFVSGFQYFKVTASEGWLSVTQ